MSHWWLPAHNIAYEHAFHHAVVDFLEAIKSGEPIRPNFEDGYKSMLVLEVGLKSSDTKKQIDLS